MIVENVSVFPLLYLPTLPVCLSTGPELLVHTPQLCIDTQQKYFVFKGFSYFYAMPFIGSGVICFSYAWNSARKTGSVALN